MINYATKHIKGFLNYIINILVTVAYDGNLVFKLSIASPIFVNA
jgi:hypothetical protein